MQRIEFGLRLRGVHIIGPMGSPRHGPRGQQFAFCIGPALPSIQAGPAPVLRATHQVRPQCVALNVSRNRVKVIVLLDGERFEAPLIHVPRASGFTLGMPALRVGQGQPTDEVRQFVVLARPNDEVPVIWHDAVAKQSSLTSLNRLSQHFFESVEIAIVLKDRALGIRAIEHVIDVSSGGDSTWATHGALL